MNTCIIKEDRVVMIDGDAVNYDFDLPANVWAIQWNGTTGEVEFNDGTPNEVITDISAYQSIIDGHATAKAAQAQEVEDEAAAIEAAKEWSEKRKDKYDALNQFEMQYDDLINSTTTWQDAIAAIKVEIPKT